MIGEKSRREFNEFGVPDYKSVYARCDLKMRPELDRHVEPVDDESVRHTRLSGWYVKYLKTKFYKSSDEKPYVVVSDLLPHCKYRFDSWESFQHISKESDAVDFLYRYSTISKDTFILALMNPGLPIPIGLNERKILDVYGEGAIGCLMVYKKEGEE